jgi:hypothetical protein
MFLGTLYVAACNLCFSIKVRNRVWHTYRAMTSFLFKFTNFVCVFVKGERRHGLTNNTHAKLSCFLYFFLVTL